MAVIIKKHREYHARAMQKPNFSTGTEGYNFSYPVLNTIEIGNLFISGGSRDIQIERMGKTTWSFDKEKSILTKKDRKGTTETHYIDNPKELYDAMDKYWEENAQALEDKNNDITEKRAEAGIGNQNARKVKDVTEEDVIKHEEIEIAETYVSDPFERGFRKVSYQPANVVSPSRSRGDYLD